MALTILASDSPNTQDTLLEQLRHKLEAQALEGGRDFINALNDTQWIRLQSELKATGCNQWVLLLLKLIRTTEQTHEKIIEED